MASHSTISSANGPSLGGKDTTVNYSWFYFTWFKANNLSFSDLLQAAMDTGTALATVIIFFCLSYNNVTLSWWGNNVGSNTDDANSVPWLKVPTGGHFGKGPGEF